MRSEVAPSRPRMNPRAQFRAWTLGVSLLLAACGGGGGSGGGDGMPAGGGGGTAPTTPAPTSPAPVAPDLSGLPESMTLEERSAALDQVNAIWTAINTGTADGDNQALVAAIRNRPDFADAGISADGTVWARFRDGYPTLFISRDAAFLNLAAAAAARAPSAFRAQSELPLGDKAVLIDVDNLAAGSLTTIEPALANKGYATSRPAGTVEDFLNLKNVSVLMISSHGGTGTYRDGTSTYAVVTNQFVVSPASLPPAQSANLSALYRAEELTMANFRVRNTNGPASLLGKFWVITEKFVKNNMSFTSNSLVVFDTCELFLDQSQKLASAPAPDRAAYENFRAALRSRGAGAILGWDGQVSPSFAANVMQLFFDRVLGANAYQPETPPQRPFPLKDVIDWLASSGQSREGSGAKLLLSYPAAIPVQLVPTIARSAVFYPAPGAEFAGKAVLEISGDFGNDPGPANRSVTLSGRALTVLKWQNDLIQAELPDGTASSGGVVVEARGHRSNVAPLTGWTGTVAQNQTLTSLDPAAKLVITCNVRGATDVHAFRNQPAGPLARFNALAIALAPARCAYEFSGSWNRTESGDSILYELSGSGTTGDAIAGGTFEVVGSLVGTPGAGPALPASWTSNMGVGEATGTLTRTNLTNGDRSSSPHSAQWFILGSGGPPRVQLGSNFGFTAVNACEPDPEVQCTETWQLTPGVGTMPAPDTES